MFAIRDTIDRKHCLLCFFRPNSIYTYLGKEQQLILQVQLYPFTASVINEAVQRKTDFSELTGSVTEIPTTYPALSTDVWKEPTALPMESCFMKLSQV